MRILQSASHICLACLEKSCIAILYMKFTCANLLCRLELATNLRRQYEDLVSGKQMDEERGGGGSGRKKGSKPRRLLLHNERRASQQGGRPQGATV